MKLRNISIYLIILVALGAYVYFVEIKHKKEQQAQEEKAAKILQLEKDKVVRVELKTSDGTIELQKPGESWVLTSPIKTGADQIAVGSLIHSALDAKPEKVILEKDANWDEFGLDKPAFTITLATKDKKTEVFFGATNPSKSSYYARVDEQPKLLLVADTLKNSLNKSPYDLRDKSILTLAAEDVDRVVVSRGQESVELELQDKDKWLLTKPERFRAKQSVIEAGLNSLAAIKAKEIIDEPKTDGDPYGLDNPQESITIGGKNIEQTLQIGKAAGEVKASAPGATPNFYAKIKGHDTVYVIEGRAIKALKADAKELRDRAVVTFNPSDIEKVEITLDGKTWLATQGPDKVWSLEKPEKKDKLDNWAISGMLWSLKDLEWKSILKPGADPTSTQLSNPQLVAQFFKKGDKDPIVLKAGWPQEEQKKNEPAETSIDDKKETTGKTTAVPDEKKTPSTVSVSVQPHEEENAIFVLDGNFLERLREDLQKLAEKK
ncbi:MAG: DUF4340 domain-containing protein [Desulfomonile tiedjei]|uniref:DUF4340 domain-containing protein n=1 Tax=Desulfomonile tiedjei TaxID=2358 RepID=A0A9D6Z4E0_9BACT|nr:DUF4340 domain-containing protein [Desulfomonile tiedjei]